MPADDSVLERRAALLGEKLTSRRDLIREAVAPAGQRLPFTEQLTKGEALAWWQQHRYDELGARVLANMQPVAIQELDLALSRQVEAEQMETIGAEYGAEV